MKGGKENILHIVLNNGSFWVFNTFGAASLSNALAAFDSLADKLSEPESAWSNSRILLDLA